MNNETVYQQDTNDYDISLMRVFQTLRFFSIAKVKKADDLLNQLLNDHEFIQKYWQQNSIRRGVTIRFGKQTGEENPMADKPLEWIVIAVENNKALIISKYALIKGQLPGYSFGTASIYGDQVIDVLKGNASGYFTNKQLACLSGEPKVRSGKLFLLDQEQYEAYAVKEFGICKFVQGDSDSYWLLRKERAKDSYYGEIDMHGVRMSSGDVKTYFHNMKEDHIFIRPCTWLDISCGQYEIDINSCMAAQQRNMSGVNKAILKIPEAKYEPSPFQNNNLQLTYESDSFFSLDDLVNYLASLYNSSQNDFVRFCDKLLRSDDTFDNAFVSWLSCLKKDNIINEWKRNSEYKRTDFISTTKQYELLRLFALSGVPESEHILNDMITNSAYISRLKKTQALNEGDFIFFGHYDKSIEVFGGMPMVWRVIHTNGNKALLLSWYCIGSRGFNTGHEDCSWEESSLRQWLNNEFVNKTFTPDEAESILSSPIYTLYNETVYDKVFLLSNEETALYVDKEMQTCINLTNPNKNDGYDQWYTRTVTTKIKEGSYPDYKDEILYDYFGIRNAVRYFAGIALDGIGTAYSSSGLIRPAIWIDKSSTVYKKATTMFDDLLLPGATLHFGKYKQGSNGEIKPIEWIINKVDASTVQLISKYVLDWMPFTTNKTNEVDQPWISSTLCHWLNHDFLSEAFDKNEIKYICVLDSATEDDTYSEFCPEYAVPQVSERFDKGEKLVRIACLSYVSCPGIGSYKFRKHSDRDPGWRSQWEHLPDRPGKGISKAKPTAYAISNGAPKKGNCSYWLTSLGKDWGFESVADQEGWLNNAQYGNRSGVRPTITLDLQSDLVEYIMKTRQNAIG